MDELPCNECLPTPSNRLHREDESMPIHTLTEWTKGENSEKKKDQRSNINGITYGIVVRLWRRRRRINGRFGMRRWNDRGRIILFFLFESSSREIKKLHDWLWLREETQWEDDQSNGREETIILIYLTLPLSLPSLLSSFCVLPRQQIELEMVYRWSQ